MEKSSYAASQHLLETSLIGDPTCPWCRIAFQRLARLSRELPFRLHWQPFLLDPQIPTHGTARRIYLERRFGGLGASVTALRQVTRAAIEDGVRFAFDRIERQPDGRRAQALLVSADRAGMLTPVASLVFEAFFERGWDLGDPQVIGELATEAGLPEGVLQEAQTEELIETVRDSSRHASTSGIDGVPTLQVAGLGRVSGAQPVAVFRAIIEAGLVAMPARPATAR